MLYTCVIVYNRMRLRQLYKCMYSIQCVSYQTTTQKINKLPVVYVGLIITYKIKVATNVACLVLPAWLQLFCIMYTCT